RLAARRHFPYRSPRLPSLLRNRQMVEMPGWKCPSGPLHPYAAVGNDRVMTMIDGWVAPGLEAVRQVFGANFDKGDEDGAAFSAYHRGHKVVDLWGGVADTVTGRPWEEDTMVLTYSTTKG